MTKDVLPVVAVGVPERIRPRHRSGLFARRLAGLLLLLAAAQSSLVLFSAPPREAHVPLHAAQALEKCRAQALVAGPPPSFRARDESDRFVSGTPAVLVRGAKIWTGASNGTEVLTGDVLLDQGLIKRVGEAGLSEAEVARAVGEGKLKVVDANGAWLTPGLVDNHSHLGVYSAPALSGAADGNSRKGTIQPWLRSLDALNTHDEAYALSIAGGITTAVVLPGSANAIGGQAFTIKLRKTLERSPTAMLVEPPHDINGTRAADSTHTPWRQMKHACGENPSRVYSNTRMDTFWAFREAYNKASQLKEQQDAYCAQAFAGQWEGLGAYPEDLQWEALVDVVRGRVKAHCYEAVDLDDLIRLTNEFRFPIAAVHHAHEAYLVPDVLKRAYGHPPAAAIFAVNARYKRESYRGSEYAPRVLADNGIDVVMKSDHPVLNSRYLMFEAQQAHYYGLPEHLAIASVTSTPAKVLGLDHRVGFIMEGWDADIILWDSHPLSLGATPTQVFIDGIPQLDSPVVVRKPESFQKSPEVPNFDHETEEALKYEGLPPLKPKNVAGQILFINVKRVTLRSAHGLHDAYVAEGGPLGSAVAVNGQLVCSGGNGECARHMDDAVIVDLQGGSIEPGLTTFGSDLGLSEIRGETSTRDGVVYDPLLEPVPKVAGGDDGLVRAVDGLQFAGRDTLLAYRSGVTKAVAVPLGNAFLNGLGVFFSTGAEHKFDSVAVIQPVTALHVNIGHLGIPSVSTQVAALRKKLLALPASANAEIADAFSQVTKGVIPVIVHANNADIIATMINLKQEVEEKTGARIKMTIAGGAEAHLLAQELKSADIGVIIINSRPYPTVWESQRILPGPPLSNDSAISTLLGHGVKVGVGVSEAWMSRNTRLDIAWAALESGGRISKTDAIALASNNVEELLGVKRYEEVEDLVVTRGGDILSFEGKILGVISARRGCVDLF